MPCRVFKTEILAASIIRTPNHIIERAAAGRMCVLVRWFPFRFAGSIRLPILDYHFFEILKKIQLIKILITIK